MMEGSSVNEESFTILDKRGYQALKNAKHSLKDGGSGTISLTNLDHLISSVEQSDLGELETRLFSVLISTLRLNYVRLTLQHGVRSKDNVKILSKLVEGDDIPSRIINSLSQLIFEHDIGLPSLVSWYQENDPLSPWHTVSRAAVSAQNSDEINAARDYRRAAENKEFDFEHSLILYRKALIHLAHAGQWSEAVNLLEQQPALKTAITQRFQLYLNVSYTANNESTDKATQMLKNFVRRTRVVQEENEEGEMIERERVYFAEDELDVLRSYPFEHRRTLPHDPFSGRVTAAINTVQKSRRRNRKSFDMQFMTIMQQSSPLPIEVYDLAKEAAESNPVEGLMFFERAQSSGKFSLRDSKTLADAETSLFAKYKFQITNSSRRYLKHLSLPPLVIVDTNLLIDALVEKISSQLELASETSLDLSEQNSFHKVLISRARDGKISMWLPQVVRQELQEIGKGVSKLRDKFKNSLVKPAILDKVLKQDNLEKLTDEVIRDFNQWKPLDIRLEEDSDNTDNKHQIKEFLQDYHDIYDELSAMKKAYGGKQKRTKIDGKAIYPEAPDRVIMAIAMHLANQCLEGLGTVLIATRDGDFTLTARAFEERFGFGVVKNSRMLNAWLEI
jgi:negative regulator of replication initiation